jgi:hypothetical protein
MIVQIKKNVKINKQKILKIRASPIGGAFLLPVHILTGCFPFSIQDGGNKFSLSYTLHINHIVVVHS